MTQPITRFNPPSLPDDGAAGYSQITVVEPGRMAFISGHVAWRPNGEPAPACLSEKAELVVANARAALDAIGASSKVLIIVRVDLTDLAPFKQPLGNIGSGQIGLGFDPDDIWRATLGRLFEVPALDGVTQ